MKTTQGMLEFTVNENESFVDKLEGKMFELSEEQNIRLEIQQIVKRDDTRYVAVLNISPKN